jgi:signal transduction histidine kinase
MSLLKFQTSIQARFILVSTAILAVLCTIFLAILAWYGHHGHQLEIRNVLTEQSLSAMASHTQERKQQDYLTLQRILPHGELVESAALYGKDCHILTTTFNPTFPTDQCPPQSSNLLQIKYSDVLSPIGTIVLKLNQQALQPTYLLLWGFAVICLFLFIGLLISLCWKLFIYRPLNQEIERIASGIAPSTDELGPLGEKINSMLTKVKSHELQKERLAFAEQKFQNALKVAHDILAPLQVLMSEQKVSSQSIKAKQALLQIEGIALDLLPEKAPIALSPASMSDLLNQAITNARISFQDSPLPIIEGPQHLSVNVSVIHFVRALTNLLKNSFEVQPPDLPLRIRIERNSSQVALLTIRDNGPGMPEHLPDTTKAQGSGLGIKSAQDAIAKMGGQLTFVSNSSGTITEVSLPLIKKTVYLSPNEEIYRFGFESDNNLFDLNLVTSNKRSLILSPFDRPSQLPANLRWIQTLSPDEVELQEVKSALLIEDDKYIRAHWIQEARKAGIELHATAEIPLEIKQTDIIFLDRYLGNIDSMSWEREASKNGHQVMMISAERGTASKTPPWLLS